MDAGAPVNLGRVLPCEKRDAGHPMTFSPFPITTTPPAEMVNRLASISGSTPTRAPGSTVTFLSIMARRTTAFSPMRTLSIITEPSTSARCSTKTPGDMTDRRTVPPEIIVPPETIESKASPLRSGSSNTNFAGGNCGGLVKIGHSVLYRLKTGCTATRSMLAS